MTTYTDPGDIAHVSSTDIAEANWANAVRDRAWHRFETPSDRDSAITAPTEGMVCYILSDQTICWYNGTAWLVFDLTVQTWTPQLYVGTIEVPDLTVHEARYVRRWNSCRAWLSISQNHYDDDIDSELGLALPVPVVGNITGSSLGNGVIATNSGNYFVEVVYRSTTDRAIFRYINGSLFGSGLPVYVVVGTGLFITVNATFEWTIA